MTDMPIWLPPMLTLGGTWEEIFSTLYAVFDRDFKKARPKFQACLVRWDDKVLPGQKYEEGFWHLISKEEKDTGDRLPEFRRAERLPWCAPIISHSQESAVTVFDYMEGRGQVRTYVWLKDWDYCIIIQMVGKSTRKVAMLITAFYVTGPSQKRSLQVKVDKKVA
jgi:hypothetical protein